MKNLNDKLHPISLFLSRNKERMLQAAYMAELFESAVKKSYYEQMFKATGITMERIKNFNSILSKGDPYSKELQTLISKIQINFCEQRNEISSVVFDVLDKLKKPEEKAES